MTKQEFIHAVFERLNIKGTQVSDAILDTAIHSNLDVESAARIVAGNPELKKLLEEEAIFMKTLKPKKKN